MIDSKQSIYDLPYRARIMMSANIDNLKSTSCIILNSKLNSANNLQNLKPLNAKSSGSKSNCNYAYSSADLQPLQWLQQDAILSITPLDNEEEFVPGKDDITSITTSPVKVEVISESKSDDTMSQNSTIAEYYRYQAMRAAMANGHQNSSNCGGNAYRQHGYISYCGNSVGGVRPNNSSASNSHGLCHSVNEYQKPPFSYTHIIFMAIETNPNKAMTVNDIYVWCETHFPYYTQAGVGWKNSLRHNLSINKSFKKISRDGRGGPGRGAYWVVEPRERNNLIDAIRRSPCSLGSFPFLNNTNPWGTGNCYSNNIFQSTNTLNNNLATLSATRSILSNKLNYNTDLQSTSRGPLLRIGGQLTDASNLIRSTPIIQRIGDSGNTIDLPKSSQILPNNIGVSNVPLIQFDQIKFESELTTFNESTDSNDFYSTLLNEEDCRGKVFVVDDSSQSNPELYQQYIDIMKSLINNEMEKSNSTIPESTKNYLEHSKIKKQSNLKSKSNNILPDILQSEDMVITKKNCLSKQIKRCKTIKNRVLSDSDETESSISIKEFSEMSDTDFNSKMTSGLRHQRKEKKHMYLTKLKSLSNNRKSSHSRNRINNIIRAPHLDHVYAFLQDFLAPAISSDNQLNFNRSIDDRESFSSTFADDRSASINLSQCSLSKRSKHKLQTQRKSMKKIYCSDSEGELFSNINYENISKKLIRNIVPIYKAGKNISLKSVKNSSRLLKENSEFINKTMYQECNSDDDEERENRFYDKNNTSVYKSYKSIKNEEFDHPFDKSNDICYGNKSNTFDYNMSPVKRIRLNKDPNIKRKVGRPKKSEYCSYPHTQNDHRSFKEKKFKKKLKPLKRELKYLKECNSNKDLSNHISNRDEQTAINILASLQRKNQEERIKNMYKLSSYIEKNNSDSNMS